jgi:hypothetical protein
MKKKQINKEELFNQYVQEWKKTFSELFPNDIKFQEEMVNFMINQFTIESYLEAPKQKEYLKKCRKELQPDDFFFEDF